MKTTQRKNEFREQEIEHEYDTVGITGSDPAMNTLGESRRLILPKLI